MRSQPSVPSALPLRRNVRSELLAYDGNGNRLTTTDPLTNATTNTYNVLNRLLEFPRFSGHFQSVHMC